MIKSKYITKLFQNFLKDKDIRIFRNSFLYYLIFRVIRKFLANDILLNIYGFKIFGSVNKKRTSYFLLKKCEFGDFYEFQNLKKFSNLNNVFLLDCGCNYGFYSFFLASLKKTNYVVSIEASKNTSNEFLKNLEINNFENISFFNKAISDEDDKEVSFNESINDWESSVDHQDFTLKNISNIKTVKIDTLLKSFDLKKYILFIKLDVEGHEMKTIKGGLNIIKNFSPIIIIEFSKFFLGQECNKKAFKKFLIDFDYKIYDVKKNMVEIDDIVDKINKLPKNYKTIGNYFLIKSSSKQLDLFNSYD